MADFTGTILDGTEDDIFLSGFSDARGLSLLDGGETSTTTYYYVESDGDRGSTTTLASVPAGAVVRRTVVT